MRRVLLALAILLTGCTASVSEQIDGSVELVMPHSKQPERNLTQSGSTFLGKFATASALNSRRSFVSDYHGEVRFTVYKNEKIECRWWAEGRITDDSLYDGPNGFIEAYSSLCTGRLQRDNTFEFRGAYINEGVGVDDPEAEQTFTMKGTFYNDRITGDLSIGSMFRNDVILTDDKEVLDLGDGVLFEAVLLE